MKNILIIFFTLYGITISPSLRASENLDSLSFEYQRQKVNTLLDERNSKFGEYDLSLDQKSGFFGLFKSGKDMQKSIDILKSIVLNDNNILLETRKLIAIKDIEKERFQQLANQYDNQVTAYMKTISKLQAENEKLREQIKTLESQDHSNNTLFYVSVLFILGLLFIIYRLYTRLKTKNVTLL